MGENITGNRIDRREKNDAADRRVRNAGLTSGIAGIRLKPKTIEDVPRNRPLFCSGPRAQKLHVLWADADPYEFAGR